MLSAHCVCATLNAEHAVIRQTIASMDALLRGAAWRLPGDERERIGVLMRFLQVFDDTCHTPKERRLALALKGRSADADRLMGELVADRERDTALLSQALQLLLRLEAGNVVLLDSFFGVLQRHRADVLRRIHTEERSLQEMAKQLLSEDEWAQIASEMSWVPKAPTLDDAQWTAEGPVSVTQRRRADDIAARAQSTRVNRRELAAQRTPSNPPAPLN